MTFKVLKLNNSNSSKTNVPFWDSYFPRLDETSKEQLEFYSFFKNNIIQGKYIDIEDNTAYVYLYAYELIDELTDDVIARKGHSLHFLNIEKLITELSKLLTFYCQNNQEIIKYQNLKYFLTHWMSDAYILKGDYDNAWRVLRETRLSMIDIIHTLGNCSSKYLEGKDILNLLRSDSGLTKFVTEHRDAIALIMTSLLNAFHSVNGSNIVEHFIKQFDYRNLTENDFAKLKSYYLNEADFIFWKSEYPKFSKSWYKGKEASYYNRSFFSGAGESKKYNTDRNIYYRYIKIVPIPFILEIAIVNELKRMLRECENTVREERSLPKVGEGWISETYLFYELCKAFPNERIIHHGRPAWLGKQHLDVFFPERNIGLEYQGKQHAEPITFFGGISSFEKLFSLDNKKRKLCYDNNCFLIYVTEGYNINNIVQQIEKKIIELT